MNMWFYAIISGFMVFSISATLCANTVEYGQKLNEADWTVVSSNKRCVLQQQIALYGKVEFEQRFRDQSMQFNVYINRVPQHSIKATITAIPPQWNHVTLLRPIGKVTLNANNKALSVEHKIPLRIISELEDGMFPTLSYKNWQSGRNDVQVAISPINFRDHLPKFLACIAGLPLKPVIVVVKPKPKQKPIKIKKIVENTEPDTVFFTANSASLRATAKKKLRLLAKKVKKNKKTKHIIVSGYSDNTGSKTQSTAISKQRAINVQSYLEGQGIQAKQLFTRYFGRDHAILSNKTAKGRARNRRVHIDIIYSNLKLPR